MGKPTKPTKPTSPKGISRSGAGRRGRPVGYSPDYTPEQIQRYKSQLVRYSKAVELANAGPDYINFNGQILASDNAAALRNAGVKDFKLTDRVLFQYASARSGRDYWTVRYSGGGLEQVETFTDAITKTGTETCSEPVVMWQWDNPQFDWLADGIKLCPGSEGSGGGGGGGGGPYYFPDPYYPVAENGRRVRIVIRYTSTLTTSAIGCGLMPPQTGGTVTNTSVTEFGSVFLNSDSAIVTEYVGSDRVFTGNYATLFGSEVSIFLTINGTRFAPLYASGFASGTANYEGVGPPGGTENFCTVAESRREILSSTLEIIPLDGLPINPLPPNQPPPPLPADPNSGGGTPDTRATAGGTFTSNTFMPTAAIDVQSTLDYTTVPDIGAISGAIAVELWGDALLDSYGETPGNGGSGALDKTFRLEAGQSYYFKIIIPETCYCNLAKVIIGGLGFACDCPDYSKTQEFTYNTRYNSEQAPRDWTASDAGCDQEAGCKHIIGTKLFLGVPYEVPTDFPL